MRRNNLKEEIKNIKNGIGITNEQKVKCSRIIHSVSGINGGIGCGLAQFPFADTIPLTTLQIGMIIRLGTVFNMRVSEAVARSILKGAIASIGGREISKWVGGWVCVAGNIINASTAIIVTEFIGWSAVAQFAYIDSSNIDKYKVNGIEEGYEMASKEYGIKFNQLREDAMRIKEEIIRDYYDEKEEKINYS